MASRAQLLAVAVLALVGSTMAADKKKTGPGSVPLTLFDALNNTANYTAVAGLMALAGLENFNLTGNNTVFAPDNNAVEMAGMALADLGYNESFLTSNISLLVDVLKYHIVPGVTLVPDDLEDGDQLETLLGENITIAVDNGTVLIVGAMNATVRAKPLGIKGDTKINSIDTLLIPPSLVYLLDGPPVVPNISTNSTPPPPPSSAAAFRVAPMAVAAAFLMSMVL